MCEAPRIMENIMSYSSDTGEKLLTKTERHDADIADDDIQFILGIKDDLNHMLERIEASIRCKILMDVDRNELHETGIAMHQLLDDLVAKDYERLHNISASIAWPVRVSEYKRVPTNPATYEAKKEAL